MPPFLLIVFLLVAGTLFTQVFVLTPLNFLHSVNLSGGIFLTLLALVLIWSFGE
jgi:hypothetical protein